MKVRLSDHAIARYQQRVKPTLDLKACATDLHRLLGSATEPTGEVDWSHGSHEADAFLVLSDGVALALQRERRCWVAATCITRAGHSESVRAAKNKRRSDLRAARQFRKRHDKRNREGYRRDAA